MIPPGRLRRSAAGVPNGDATGAAGRWSSFAFPLASLGVHLAFIPVLVLLLPRRVEAIAAGQSPLVLSWLLLAGAVTAGIANVLAGYWSDRWLRRYGNRRGLIAIGLAALMTAFVWFSAAKTITHLALAVIAFQFTLNLAFAPLAALLSDHVPDSAKGGVAGLLNAALPLSSGGVVLLAWLYPKDSAQAFLVNALLVAACMAPLLIKWDFAAPIERAAVPQDASPAAGAGRDFTLAWIARFLVQLGAAFAIGFLFLLVSDRIEANPAWAGGRTPSEAVALLSLAAAAVAIGGSVGGGRVSDRTRRRRVPLAVAAALAALCMAVLGSGAGWLFFLAAYALFQLALAAFLAIDAALVAQLVSGNPNRGSMLGIMNLSNTLPAVLAPAIAIFSLDLTRNQDLLGLLLFAGAAAAACAAFAVLFIRRIR